MNRQQKLAAAEVLERAGLVLSLPEWWTHSYYARDEKGNALFASEEEAVCFCAKGACLAAAHDYDLGRAAGVALANFLDCSDAAIFNNTPGRTNTEVSQAMLACAEKLRKDAA